VKAVKLTKQLYNRLKSALPIGNRVGKALFIIKKAAYSLIGVAYIVESSTLFYWSCCYSISYTKSSNSLILSRRSSTTLF
jgi:hypothetical protein